MLFCDLLPHQIEWSKAPEFAMAFRHSPAAPQVNGKGQYTALDVDDYGQGDVALDLNVGLGIIESFAQECSTHLAF